MSKQRAITALMNNARRLGRVYEVSRQLTGESFDDYDPRPSLGQALEGVIKTTQEDARKRWGWAGAVDGWPAGNFYAALWHYTRPGRREVMTRARIATDGPDTRYTMRHAFTPSWFEMEWDPRGQGGDCSGFMAFCIDRAKAGGPDWHNAKGQDLWLHTGSIWSDARGDQRMFRQLAAPRPGCLFVYPDHDGRQGHTGLILTVDDDGTPGDGVDCSYKQGKRGDAIRVRSMAWTQGGFARGRRLIFCEPIWWEDYNEDAVIS